MLFIVLDRSYLKDLYTNMIEFFGNKSRVGIYDLTDKDLVTYGDDFC